MMRQLIPILLAAAVYIGVRYCHHQKIDKKLAIESLIFSLVASVVMYVYHNTYGYEYFDTNYGDMCPPGHIKVDDPLNAEQRICRPDPQGKAVMHSSEK
jgi:hypothetical protein